MQKSFKNISSRANLPSFLSFFFVVEPKYTAICMLFNFLLLSIGTVSFSIQNYVQRLQYHHNLPNTSAFPLLSSSPLPCLVLCSHSSLSLASISSNLFAPSLTFPLSLCYSRACQPWLLMAQNCLALQLCHKI